MECLHYFNSGQGFKERGVGFFRRFGLFAFILLRASGFDFLRCFQVGIFQLWVIREINMIIDFVIMLSLLYLLVSLDSLSSCRVQTRIHVFMHDCVM